MAGICVSTVCLKNKVDLYDMFMKCSLIHRLVILLYTDEEGMAAIKSTVARMGAGIIWVPVWYGIK